MENYFGRPLLSRQEEGLLKEQKRQEIIRHVTSDYEGTPVQSEVEYIMHMLKGDSREDFGELEQQLYLSAEIFNKLPYRKEQKIYLAVFAAMLTGNPHAFDRGTVGGRILEQIIRRSLEQRNLLIEGTEIFPAYKRQKSFLVAGILLDDVSNYAMVCNVEAVKKDGTTIYYSGDLDPEGILIAQKLADYYRGKFHFWHMDPEDYKKSRSEEVISDRRMKILDKITDVGLIPVVDEIKKYKTAGYQERIFV